MRLSEPVVQTIVSRRVHPDSVEADLGRVTPAAEEAQRAPTLKQTRRDELRFDSLVVFDRITAAHVDQVIGRDAVRVAETGRETAARIRVVEKRVPFRRPVGHDLFESVDDFLSFARYIRMQVLRLLRLLLLDSRLTRRRLRLLRDGIRRGPSCQRNDGEQPPHSYSSHLPPTFRRSAAQRGRPRPT